ncbi:hypothetical protein PR048_015154 [Dryococelus australis]|uniref:Uncharacterized protein n=1 Tax=Dryococelus australis TaxID=614101 RepID=A0ABQ9HGN0_9NEOP|nr:hypothetical protein PR048_015154 [Dryococelus australis]
MGSHFMVFEALMKGLIAKGHQVVVLSHFPQNNPVPNYTDIDVSGSLPNLLDNVTIDTALRWRRFPSSLDFHWIFNRETCQIVMNHMKTQALLKSVEKFGLVITEIFGSKCAVGFSWKFNAPLVQVISSVPLPWTRARIGNVDHPSYMPNYFLPYTDKMGFWQRLKNTLYHLIINTGNMVYNSKPTSILMKDYFGADVPSVEQLTNNASLILVNSHLSINWPRPAVPAFVEVGG